MWVAVVRAVRWLNSPRSRSGKGGMSDQQRPEESLLTARGRGSSVVDCDQQLATCAEARELAYKHMALAQQATHGRPDVVREECRSALGALTGHVGQTCLELRLRIEVTRAWSVMEFEGQGPCLQLLDRVASVARKSGFSNTAVLAAAQAAMTLARCQEMWGAWERFTRITADEMNSLPAVDRAKIRINRIGTGILVQKFGDALKDIEAALEDSKEAGDCKLEAVVKQNSAYLRYLLGHHVEALQEMTELRSFGMALDTVNLDTARAQVLIQLGLVFEARDVLAEAVADSQGKAEPLRLAEPYLELAWVCRMLGEFSTSDEYVRRAQTLLATVGASGWLLRVELTRLITHLAWLASDSDAGQASTVEGSDEILTPESPQRLQEAASDLESRAEVSGAEYIRMRAALLQAEIALQQDQPDRVRAHLSRCSFLKESGLLTSRLAYARVRAWQADRDGEYDLRDSVLESAARDYAEQALTTASLDIRMAAATHAAELSELDVLIGTSAGEPADALRRLERWRVAWLGGGTLTPPDESLTEKLAALRQARKDLLEAASPKDHEAAREAIRGLEQRVREDGWLQSASPSAPVSPVASETVRQTLFAAGGTYLCAYTCGPAEVIAVIISPDGADRVVKVGGIGEITEAVERVRADWHAYLVVCASGQPSSAMVETVRRSLEFSLQDLDEKLLGPLECRGMPLVITPCLNFADVPWGALPSRRGRPTTLSRSASAWTYAAQRVPQRPVGEPLRVQGAWGPELKYASSEVERIAKAWGKPTAEVAFACTSDGVKRALREADVVSLAVHGQHDLRNPLFSTLHLDDGVTSAHDFLPEQVRASLVFVSACEGGRVTRRVGDEMWGLVAALLGAGVRTVVAPTAKVPDNQAMLCMARTHQLLVQGVDVATAVAKAVASVDLAAGSFVVYGGPWSTKAILRGRATGGSACGLAVTA